MAKKYQKLIKIGYPMSNRAYVIAVNNYVLEDEGQPHNNNVDIDSGLEPKTETILIAAGLQNRANKGIR